MDAEKRCDLVEYGARSREPRQNIPYRRRGLRGPRERGSELIESLRQFLFDLGLSLSERDTRRKTPDRVQPVIAALLRIGWTVRRTSGSHRVLERPGWSDVVFAFHDSEEIGPRMLARIGRRTGLTPDDL